MNAENLVCELLGSVVEAGTRALRKEILPSNAGVSEHKLRQRGSCDTTWAHARPLSNNSMETSLVSNEIIQKVFCCISWKDFT